VTELRQTLEDHLLTELNPDESRTQEQTWLACAENAPDDNIYERDLAALMTEIACTYWPDQPFAAEGIARTATRIDDFFYSPYSADLDRQIGRGLLGMAGNACPVSDQLSSKAKRRLHFLAADKP
jgi:hypothetical protein